MDMCGVSRCRCAAVLTYLGQPLCQRHWGAHCERETGEEVRAALQAAQDEAEKKEETHG